MIDRPAVDRSLLANALRVSRRCGLPVCIPATHVEQSSARSDCRRARRRRAQELGLPENARAPLLGFIGRLDYQKGVDLIRDNFQWIMDEGCQLILLGSGRADLETSLRCAQPRQARQGGRRDGGHARAPRGGVRAGAARRRRGARRCRWRGGSAPAWPRP